MDKKDKQARIRVLRAMDTIAKCLNNENSYAWWAYVGIPDGAVNETTKDEDLEWLCDDDTFSELLLNFCRLFGMSKTMASGFLYCDGVVSAERY